VAGPGEMQRGRPAQISVAPQDQNSHLDTFRSSNSQMSHA
jgi:hypothetical protein